MPVSSATTSDLLSRLQAGLAAAQSAFRPDASPTAPTYQPEPQILSSVITTGPFGPGITAPFAAPELIRSTRKAVLSPAPEPLIGDETLARMKAGFVNASVSQMGPLGLINTIRSQTDDAMRRSGVDPEATRQLVRDLITEPFREAAIGSPSPTRLGSEFLRNPLLPLQPGRVEQLAAQAPDQNLWSWLLSLEDGAKSISILTRPTSADVPAGAVDPEYQHVDALAYTMGALATYALEGPASDLFVLSKLKALSQSKQAAPFLRKTAQKALDFFITSKEAPAWHRIRGQTALGVTTAAGQLAAYGASPEEAAVTLPLVALGGGILGTAIHGAQAAGRSAADQLGEYALKVPAVRRWHERMLKLRAQFDPEAAAAPHLRTGPLQADELEDVLGRAAADPERAPLYFGISQKTVRGEPLDGEQQAIVDQIRQISALRSATAEVSNSVGRAAVAKASGATAPEVPPTPRKLPELGENYLRNLGDFGDRIYHEASIRNALPYIDDSWSEEIGDAFFATTKDLALGQGSNRGMLIELDPAGLQGQVNRSKPGWDFAYAAGNAELIAKHNRQIAYQNAVRSFTIKSDAQTDPVYSWRLRSTILPRLRRQGWIEETLPDGSLRFSRPSEPPELPLLPVQPLSYMGKPVDGGFGLPSGAAPLATVSGLAGATGGALVGGAAGAALAPEGERRRGFVTGAGIGAAVGGGTGASLGARTASRLSQAAQAGQFTGPHWEAYSRAIIQSEPKGLIEQFSDFLESGAVLFKDAFLFEWRARKYPSITGTAGLDHSDDFALLKAQVNASQRLILDWQKTYMEPLKHRYKGSELASAYDVLKRMVFLHDFVETAERGIPLPGDMTLAEARAALADLRPKITLEIERAFELRRAFTTQVRAELIQRGRLGADAGYDFYVTHMVLRDLAQIDADATGNTFLVDVLTRPRGKKPTPARVERSRPGALQTAPHETARRGSDRPISDELLELDFRAFRRFLRNNAIDEFIEGVEKTFHTSRDDLVSRLSAEGHDPKVIALVLRDLDSGFRRATLPDGTQLAVWTPDGPGFYRTNAVSDDMLTILRTVGARGIGMAPTEVTDLIAKAKAHSVLAVGKPRELILPAELADRYNKFYRLTERRGIPDLARNITGEWKRNTIWWGLADFFMMQVLGDFTNLLVHNPQAFLDPAALWKPSAIDPNRRRPISPMFRTVQSIFAHYRTPMLSPEQAGAAVFGGGVGLLAPDLVSEDPWVGTRWASVALGAGLGYSLATGKLAGTSKYKPFLASYYDLAQEYGLLNTFYQTEVGEIHQRVLGGSVRSAELEPRSPTLRAWDTVRTLLVGKQYGDPYEPFGMWSRTVETLNKERENIARVASFMQMLESGVDGQVAAKRAAASLVDYNRFTEFEDRYLRGFLLPFYAFYRHNIPNWVKAATFQSPGGKPKTAAAAALAIGGFDLISGIWNTELFPREEAALDPKIRNSFHIIAGNPVTREPYRNKKGDPIVIGWEMPYEMALEFFGLARPAAMMAELFGADFHNEASLVQRVRDAEGFDRLAAVPKTVLRGMWRQTAALLSPFLKVVPELLSNQQFHFGVPLVPERYFGTEIQHEKWVQHIAATAFRQYRQGVSIFRQLQNDRFDLATSPLMGLPLRYTSDRDARTVVHKFVDRAELEHRQAVAPYMDRIDKLRYQRQDIDVMDPDEPERVQKIAEAAPEVYRAEVMRYWADRVATTDVSRRLKNMDQLDFTNLMMDLGTDEFRTAVRNAAAIDQKIDFAKSGVELTTEQLMVFYYLGGGKDWFNDANLRMIESDVPTRVNESEPRTRGWKPPAEWMPQ